MKLPEGEMNPAQLRETQSVYGDAVSMMAIQVRAWRSVLRKFENDPETHPSQLLDARRAATHHQ